MPSTYCLVAAFIAASGSAWSVMKPVIVPPALPSFSVSSSSIAPCTLVAAIAPAGVKSTSAAS